MMPYKQKYLKHFGYGEQEYVFCERCKDEAVDIHHIHPKGMGGSKLMDNIENLMALCRVCHNMAHSEHIKKDELQTLHDRFLIKFV